MWGETDPVTHHDESYQGTVGHHLQAPPVPDEVSLESQEKFPQSEGYVDTYPHHHGGPVAHVLHHQDEADHEAGHPPDPRDEPEDWEDDEPNRAGAESSREARDGDEEKTESKSRDAAVTVREPTDEVSSDHEAQHVGRVDHRPQVGPLTDQLEVLHQGGGDQTPVVEELVVLAVSPPASHPTAVLRHWE